MKYWVMGEFPTGDELKEALEHLKEEAHGHLDAYSPYPVDGVAELLELPASPVRWIGLGAGVFGAAAGYLIQWFANDANWPLNVGGRPPHAAPSFIPDSFETMELFAAFAIFFGLLLLLRFPQVYHPVFEVEEFKTASEANFWVSVTVGAKSDAEKVEHRLKELHALHTAIVPEELP